MLWQVYAKINFHQKPFITKKVTESSKRLHFVMFSYLFIPRQIARALWDMLKMPIFQV